MMKAVGYETLLEAHLVQGISELITGLEEMNRTGEIRTQAGFSEEFLNSVLMYARAASADRFSEGAVTTLMTFLESHPSAQGLKGARTSLAM